MRRSPPALYCRCPHGQVRTAHARQPTGTIAPLTRQLHERYRARAGRGRGAAGAGGRRSRCREAARRRRRTWRPTRSSACNATTANSISYSTHDVGSGNNRLLIVGISFRSEADTQTVNTVTWDADAGGAGTPVGLSVVPGTEQLTCRHRTTDDVRVEIWSLLNPDTGTNGTIAIDLDGAGTSPISCGAASFANVDQTTPFDGVGLPTSDSLNDGVVDGDFVSRRRRLRRSWHGRRRRHALGGHWPNSVLEHGREPDRDTDDISGAASTEPGAASVTHSMVECRIGTSDWVFVGLNIKHDNTPTPTPTNTNTPTPTRRRSRTRRRTPRHAHQHAATRRIRRLSTSTAVRRAELAVSARSR